MKLAISIYPGEYKYEEVENLVKETGATMAFTSLLMPEGDTENRTRDILTLFEDSKKLGLTLIADLNSYVFNWVTPKQMKEAGLEIVRIDDDIEEKEIVRLQKDFKVSINATVLGKKDVDSLISKGLDIKKTIPTHNFYPKKGTGIDMARFVKQNELMRSYGVEAIGAFIPGNVTRYAPTYEGLGTLEIMRYQTEKENLMMMEGLVDFIMIGDYMPNVESIKEYQEISNKDYSKTTEIDVEWLAPEFEWLLTKDFTIRRDSGVSVLRLQESRTYEMVYSKDDQGIPVTNNTSIRRYDIVVANDNYGRYSGEVAIYVQDQDQSNRENVIGRVSVNGQKWATHKLLNNKIRLVK